MLNVSDATQWNVQRSVLQALQHLSVSKECCLEMIDNTILYLLNRIWQTSKEEHVKTTAITLLWNIFDSDIRSLASSKMAEIVFFNIMKASHL
jgi:hypothetical protein